MKYINLFSEQDLIQMFVSLKDNYSLTKKEAERRYKIDMNLNDRSKLEKKVIKVLNDVYSKKI